MNEESLVISADSINLSTLRWVSYEDRFQIPTTGGIYFAGDTAGAVLYIGLSRNLQKRIRKGHHALAPAMKRVLRFAWIEGGGSKLEAECIARFKPRLNVTGMSDLASSPSDRGGWMSYCQLCDALGVTRRRLLKLIDAGHLPPVALSCRIYLSDMQYLQRLRKNLLLRKSSKKSRRK